MTRDDEQHRDRTYEHVLEELPVAVFVLDAEGQPIFANRASRELLGKEITPDVPADQLAELYQAYVETTDEPYPTERMPIVRALAGDTTTVDDMTIAHPQGRRHLEVWGGPVVRAGEITHAVAVFRDRTEANQQRMRLARSERMASIGTLASGIAHELNNPLTYLIANLDELKQALSRSTIDPSQVASLSECVAHAAEGAERIRQTVAGIQSVSRGDDELGGVADVHHAIDAALALAQPEIRLRGRLVQRVGDVPFVAGDESRLTQVFVNLLINAAQALPANAARSNEIVVTTSTLPSGAALIEIQDNGVGIPAEALPHVFDPFFTGKPVGMGAGLGLSICHGIVSSMGGSIRVSSRIGKGTRFSVELPASEQEPSEPERMSSPDWSEGPAARVLVIDDEPSIRRSIERILRTRHDVYTAASAEDALAILQAESFDVILCDLMMPDVTGMEFFRRLAKSRAEMAARVVFITGGAFTSEARSFLQQIPNRCLHKPFNHHELGTLIREILEAR